MNDSALSRFAQGFGAVPRAIGLIRREPRLRKLALWPAIISFLLLGGGAFLALRYGGLLVERFWLLPGGAPGWLQAIQSAAELVVRIVAMVVWVVVLLFGSQIIAEPFLDPLSESTESSLGVADPPKLSVIGLIGGLGRVLRDVAVDLTCYLVAMIGVLLVGLIPVIGVFVGPAVGWLVNATFAAVSNVGAPLSRRGFGGLARWRAMRGDRARLLGLGTGIVLLLLVPLAQVITLPIAIVAGTIAIVEAERAGRITRPAA